MRSLFRPGQGKLPRIPRHLLGGESQTDVLLQEGSKHQQFREGRNSTPPPAPRGKKAAFSPLYYVLGSFFLLYAWDESVQAIFWPLKHALSCKALVS